MGLQVALPIALMEYNIMSYLFIFSQSWVICHVSKWSSNLQHGASKEDGKTEAGVEGSQPGLD